MQPSGGHNVSSPLPSGGQVVPLSLCGAPSGGRLVEVEGVAGSSGTSVSSPSFDATYSC